MAMSCPKVVGGKEREILPFLSQDQLETTREECERKIMALREEEKNGELNESVCRLVVSVRVSCFCYWYTADVEVQRENKRLQGVIEKMRLVRDVGGLLTSVRPKYPVQK